MHGVARTSAQPDAAFRAWVERAGGAFEWDTDAEGEETLTVTGPGRGLRPLDADVDAAPDAALPLAATLAFAGGTSRLTGVARLRDKESDRLAAAADLLGRAGASARIETGGGVPALVIDGAGGVPRAGARTNRCPGRRWPRWSSRSPCPRARRSTTRDASASRGRFSGRHGTRS